MTNDTTLNNIVVVIDQFTKGTVESVAYDVLSKHVAVITDIRELNTAYAGSAVVIFEPAVSFLVTPEIAQELIDKLGISLFVVFQDDAVVTCLQGLAHLVKADYSNISWNLVYAIVHADLAILEPYQRSVRVLDSFREIKSRIPPDLQDYMDRFRGSYLNLVQSTKKLIELNARQQEHIRSQDKIGEQMVAGVTELKRLLERSQDKVNAYEALLSEGYDTSFGGFYVDKPRVLYIKQISHVAGIDTLLSVLFTVLTKQYRSSCKVVKLVDHTNALSLRYVPNIYVPVTDPYNTSELLQNDFIMKLGSYSIMFDTLMLNRSGLQYLIVHDLRGTMGSALDSTLVDLRINEVSNDYALLGEYDNTLSDNPQHSDFVWSFNECQKHTGSNVSKLAGHPTVTALLDLLL